MSTLDNTVRPFAGDAGAGAPGAVADADDILGARKASKGKASPGPAPAPAPPARSEVDDVLGARKASKGKASPGPAPPRASAPAPAPAPNGGGGAGAARAGALGGIGNVIARLNPFASNAEQEQKVRDLAAGWAELEARMRATPVLARDLRLQHDAWVGFYARWQAGDKNEAAINVCVNELTSARAIALKINWQDVPNKLPPVEDSAARRAAEWVNQHAPTLRGVMDLLDQNAVFRSKAKWLFSDPNPEQAARLAIDPAWPTDPDERMRALRTLNAQILWTADALRKDGLSRLKDAQGTVVLGSDPRPVYPTPAHNFAAATLARTPMVFLPPGEYVAGTVVTNGGSPLLKVPSSPTTPLGGDTGSPILIAVAVVLCFAMCATAVTCVIELRANVIDRQLARGSDTARLMELTKAGVALIGDHARREQEAQHTIPFTDQEIQFLKSIEECQNLICAKTEQPLPVPFTNALTSVSAGFGKAVEHTGAAAEKLAEALPFVAVAAVVVGGVMLMKH